MPERNVETIENRINPGRRKTFGFKGSDGCVKSGNEEDVAYCSAQGKSNALRDLLEGAVQEAGAMLCGFKSRGRCVATFTGEMTSIAMVAHEVMTPASSKLSSKYSES